MGSADMEYRDATEHDIAAIAGLHADSWRRNYRGAFLDAFLDGDIVADRLAHWTARLALPAPDHYTIVAASHRVVVGFAHTQLDDDPDWGALVDDLHVTHDRKGGGIGTQLMAETARALIQRRPTSGLYLWVLEQNRSAQAFYEARSGTCVGRKLSGPFPSGGSAVTLRYAWADPSILVRGATQ